jgi:hypothetical protein
MGEFTTADEKENFRKLVRDAKLLKPQLLITVALFAFGSIEFLANFFTQKPSLTDFDTEGLYYNAQVAFETGKVMISYSYLCLVLSVILAANLAIKTKRLKRDPNYEVARSFEQKKKELESRLEPLRSSIRNLAQAISSKKQELENANSERGAILFEGSNIPGDYVRVFERQIESSQGIRISLSGLRAKFVDNSGKISAETGSVTYTGGLANIKGAHANFGAISKTKKQVQIINTGSAAVYLDGQDFSGVITFDDPHLAARLCNLINSLSASSQQWPKVRNATIAQLSDELDALTSENEALFRELQTLKEQYPHHFDSFAY